MPPHVSVSGQLTFDGQTPDQGSWCEGSSSRASAVISLYDEESGFGTSREISCEADDFSFDVNLWPGTYRVSARSVIGSEYEDGVVVDKAGANFALSDPDGEWLTEGDQWRRLVSLLAID